MAGCTQRQLVQRVMMPVARAPLMVGVNQVIMLSLNMVIIASMIGAGGLGFDVLTSLRSLDIGAGLEAGHRDRRARRRARPAQPGLCAPRQHDAATPPAAPVLRHSALPLIALGAALALLAARASSCRRLQTYPAGLHALDGASIWAGVRRLAQRQLFRHVRGDQGRDPPEPARAGEALPAGAALAVGNRRRHRRLLGGRRPAARASSPAPSRSSSPSPATGSRRW